MSSTRLDITVKHRAGTVVLCVCGELDVTTTDALQESIALALGHKPAVMVIDLSEVSFLASAGLTALVMATRMGAGRTSVRIVAAGRQCERPISLTGLDNVLTLHRSLDEALG